MAWRALVLADVQTGLSAQELTGIQTYALQNGQPDPTPAAIAAAMDEVRGYIAASRTIALGAEQTIPDKLVDTAIDLVVWKLVTRFPTKLMATDARRQRYNDAISRLKDVASNKFRIEIPTETTSEETAGVPLPQVSSWGVRRRVQREEDEV